MQVSNLLFNSLQYGQSIIFCGAGVSFNSGIPIVKPMLRLLLKQLGAEKNDIDKYIKSPYPFEATIENLKERLDDEDLIELLNFFGIQNPNDNHRYFAKLCSNGKLKTIVTTNFDENFELALGECGLKKNVDYFICRSKQDLQMHWGKICVLKLHGTISDISSIMTTIRQVSSKTNTESMKDILTFLFSQPDYETIIYLGYSFSDHFDISPALHSIPQTTKSAIIVQHDDTVAEKISPAANPLINSKFPNSREVQCNFNETIKELYALQNQVLPPHPTPIDWKTNLTGWVRKTFTGSYHRNKNATLAHLFSMAGFADTGNKYTLEELSNIDPTDMPLKMDLLGRISGYYMKDPNARDVNKALPYAEEAYKIARSIGNLANNAVFACNLAICYQMKGNIPKAEEFFKECKSKFDMISNDPTNGEKEYDDAIGNQLNYAVFLRQQGDIPGSSLLLEELIQVCEEKGSLKIKGLCCAALGRNHKLQNDLQTAIGLYKDAYEISKRFTNQGLVFSHFMIITNLIRHYNSTSEAIKFFNKEYDYVHNLTGKTIKFEDIPLNML